MIDATALAYVNMYGVLGALENLCQIDDEAREILASLKHPIALCLSVKDGPCRTFRFCQKKCTIIDGDDGHAAKMVFSSPTAFNRFIAETRPGIPVRGIPQLLTFLLGPFSRLTDRLEAILRPTEENLADPAFFRENTILTLYTVAGAISAIANHDPIGRESAKYTVDGDVSLGIQDDVHVTISVHDHTFQTIKETTDKPRAIMEFADLALANGLFAGRVSTVNELCAGRIRIAGMISMIDNMNRILDRVSVYLA